MKIHGCVLEIHVICNNLSCHWIQRFECGLPCDFAVAAQYNKADITVWVTVDRDRLREI